MERFFVTGWTAVDGWLAVCRNFIKTRDMEGVIIENTKKNMVRSPSSPRREPRNAGVVGDRAVLVVVCPGGAPLPLKPVARNSHHHLHDHDHSRRSRAVSHLPSPTPPVRSSLDNSRQIQQLDSGVIVVDLSRGRDRERERESAFCALPGRS